MWRKVRRNFKEECRGLTSGADVGVLTGVDRRLVATAAAAASRY